MQSSVFKRIVAVVLAAFIGCFAAPAGAGELVVIQIGPLGERPVPPVAQLGQGMQALFKAVNARGGIRGDRVKFTQLDDGGSPQRFVEQFVLATRRDALAVLSPFGSPTVQAMLSSGVLDQTDAVVINAVPGAEAFRKPGHPRLFHLRAGDGQQIDRVIDHVRTLGLTRLAALFVDAPGGHSELASTQESARRAGLDVAGYKSDLQHASIIEAARRLTASDTQGALVLGPPGFLVESVEALRAAGFARAVFALSYLDPDALVPLGPGKARGVGIAQAFPNPMGVTSRLQREFQAAMKSAFPTVTRYTTFQFEGYVCARLFVEAVRTARRPTAPDIARSLRAMGDTDLGGFRVDFSHGNAGSRYTDIAVVNESGRLTY